MAAIILHDRRTIETYLRQNPALHAYEPGDLDDFFWPQGFQAVAEYEEHLLRYWGW